MPPTTTSPLDRAARHVWQTARVLEQRRFAHLFLDGDPDPVETALAAHRNADHGYGHALDPEVRGPASHPAHAVAALRVLDELGRCHGQHAERICRYLTSVTTTDGALPAPAGPDGSGGPAAPEARDAAPPGPASDLLSTGPVVGLLHRNDVWNAWLFRATDYCWHVVENLRQTHPRQVRAALDFLDGVPDRPRAEAAADRLGRLVREQRLAVTDPERAAEHPLPPGYQPGEHHYPHDYARTPRSLARTWFSAEELARGLDWLAAAQLEDGGWPLRRPAAGPVAALELRPQATIEALRTLRAHGRDIHTALHATG